MDNCNGHIEGEPGHEEIFFCPDCLYTKLQAKELIEHPDVQRLIKQAVLDGFKIKELKAEKFCSDCGCKMSLWCEKDVKERMNTKNKELKAENDSLKEALEHIIEYWNRDENETAMGDALLEIIETAEQALERKP